MNTGLLFFFAVWAAAGGSGFGPTTEPPPAPAARPRRRRRSTTRTPTPSPTSATLPSTTAPPWPQVVPTGLPPFPGSGWEFDEPPPGPVQARAGQLLSTLWARGAGTWKTEQTGGRWITYQAQIVKSGKKGVVAYRVREAAPAPAPPITATTAPPPAMPTSSPAATVPVVVPTAATVPTPIAAVPTSVLSLPVLRYGAGLKPKPPSNDVRLLQTKLGITADGQFGSGTRKAVKEFQRRAGLKQDGVVGKDTWTALFAVRA